MRLKRIAQNDWFKERADEEIASLYRKCSSEPTVSREERWKNPGRFYTIPWSAVYKAQWIAIKYKLLRLAIVIFVCLMVTSALQILLRLRR